jgi:hypothetical protein
MKISYFTIAGFTLARCGHPVFVRRVKDWVGLLKKSVEGTNQDALNKKFPRYAMTLYGMLHGNQRALCSYTDALIDMGFDPRADTHDAVDKMRILEAVDDFAKGMDAA